MIDKKALGFVLVLALTLAACSKSEPPKPEKPVSVHEEMTMVVVPQAQVVWDVSNASMDEAGNPSAAKLKPEDWSNAKTALAALDASLDRLATAEKIVTATQGQKIMDQDVEGGSKPEEVQARIDADLNGFHQHAKQLKDFVAELGAAVDKKDFKTFYDKSLALDGACEGCHKAFWLKPS